MVQEVTMPSYGATALAIAFAVIMICGGFANLVIVATQIRERRRLLKEARDVLVFSLAIGDLVMTTMVVPFGFSSALANRWTTGKIGCVWYGFVTTWVGLAAILQLSLIAFERYYTLSRVDAKPVSRRRASQFSVFAWLLAFATSCFPLFGWSEYTFEGFGLHCSIVWSMKNRKYAWYCFALLIVYYVLPLIIIAVSYGKMFLVVRRMYHRATQLWGTESPNTRQNYMAQVKVAKQLLVVTVGFFIAWTPYAVMSLFQSYFNMRLPLGYYELPPLFSKTSNIYNPVIYFFMYRRLRVHAFKLVKDIYKHLLGEREIELAN